MTFKGVAIAALAAFCASSAGAAYKVDNIYHSDGKKSPKLMYEVDETVSSKNLREAAESYLRRQAGVFGLSQDLAELQFAKETKSSAGRHFHFAQVIEGLPVESAEVIVSVSEENQKIYQVFNNYYPVSQQALNDIRGTAKSSFLTDQKAFDIAWNDLRVHGSLIDEPSAERTIAVVKGRFHVVQKVYLAVEKPFGYWVYYIDVQSGEILRQEDTRITRKMENPVDFRGYRGPTWSRTAEFERYRAKKKSFSGTVKLKSGQGEGLVFDPDPRSTLNNNALRDSSPAADFESAYFRRELKDITQDGGSYRLVGPWVKIEDFESPSTAPSVSSTGRWDARRGDNAFNDVMTYYHIDKNQRYMQALGFTGDRGIQFGSISVDSDGVNGSDNSHFIPSSNRMAFGHGCVDDNEDVDVILHEYGHAIHHSINNNWEGGDTGAMGEGFGDYWAGSYSISTEGGNTFRINEVFSWDGHGDNSCWPGRRMDRLEARYDHNRNYSAHTSIGDGIQSDELWSTPLFQALLVLLERGYPRENIDRIILEAHFGLGANMKMRGMANAIIATARRLYPAEAYADIFIEKFAHHGIIDVPKAAFAVKDLAMSGAGNNGRPDPGETVTLALTMMNAGNADASGVVGELSVVTPGVEISQTRMELPNVGAGTDVTTPPIQIRISDQVACGEKLRFSLKLIFSGGAVGGQTVDFTVDTGEPIGMLGGRTHDGGLPIPDNDRVQGIESEIEVSGAEGGLRSDTLKVNIELMHTFIGDLIVKLTAPDGKSVTLHDKSGNSQDNIIGTYPTNLTAKEPLSNLEGAAMNGHWKLSVVDTARSDTGRLLKWGLEAVTGYRCE